MSEILYATKENTKEILNLWNLCFPNSPEFSKWYFKNIFSPEKTLIYTKNGIICSMLQELNFNFKNSGKATYIYGACTHPNHRKKGIMTKLLNQSFSNDKKRGINISILIPENNTLFEFYKNFNYIPTSSSIEEYFNLENPPQQKKYSNFILKKADKSDIQNMDILYSDFLKSLNTDYIIRSKNYWETQINMFNNLDGACFCLYNEKNELLSYAFIWNEQNIQIQEICFKNIKAKDALCTNISNYFGNTKKIIVSYYKKSSNKTACIKFHNNLQIKNDYIINMLFN